MRLLPRPHAGSDATQGVAPDAGFLQARYRSRRRWSTICEQRSPLNVKLFNPV